MIEATDLTKRYGSTLAVDRLSFTVPAGQVTGFLGPNGAGKPTTMRLILGLDAPTSGTVTVNGRRYVESRRPLREVGALLEAKATLGGRRAVDHLRWLALSNGIRRSRVDEVLEQVGLSSVSRRRTAGFSLGMGQRLGIAAALLGDPRVLLFDELVNGLDPEGVIWVRNLMKALAAEGRVVLLSSHLMSEMAMTADRLVIIGRGRLIAETTVDQFINGHARSFVRVRAAGLPALARLLRRRGARVTSEESGALRVVGVTIDEVGAAARAGGVALQELSAQHPSLEETYLELTRDAVDYRTEPTPAQPGARQRPLVATGRERRDTRSRP